MKRKAISIIVISVGAITLIALLLSPFASSKPDGLEYVLEKKNIPVKEDTAVIENGPIHDYQLPSDTLDSGISTILAGVIGVLATMLVVIGIMFLLKSLKRK
jgi:hypothetical protein